MDIIYDLDNIAHEPTVATIGSFDGVHRGHVAMIEETRRRAAAAGLPVTLVTFATHPRMIFDADPQPFLLSSSRVRMERLAATGVERCVVFDFNRELAAMTAREFMHKILAERLNVKLLVLGYDHRFGRPVEGENADAYIDYGREMGIEVVRAARYNEAGAKVSSSQVRRALAAGDVESAATLLGYRYPISGTVVHGAALGRELGFPTANIELEEPMQLLPQNGVYEVSATVAGEQYKGVMNVGVKPTVTGCGKRTIELFIIDFAGNLYGCNICVEFVRRLREERRFSSLDELKAQIVKDVAEVQR
ncbi:MAG: bifunctional riboflavin kinase/FAD synthetase [Bacteroidales bacterium]|nr:bifunctional riboflavin kinase/FAD synthetase [Bacteroidales bacterium]